MKAQLVFACLILGLALATPPMHNLDKVAGVLRFQTQYANKKDGYVYLKNTNNL